jgi:hypothetical protein
MLHMVAYKNRFVYVLSEEGSICYRFHGHTTFDAWQIMICRHTTSSMMPVVSSCAIGTIRVTIKFEDMYLQYQKKSPGGQHS